MGLPECGLAKLMAENHFRIEDVDPDFTLTILFYTDVTGPIEN